MATKNPRRISLRTEEDVKVKVFVPLLKEKGYDPDLCDFEKGIKVHQGRKARDIFADIIVYSDKRMQVPLIAIDTKPPNEPISDADRAQAISYARLLDKMAPLALVTNGHQVEVFDTFSKKRLPGLPARADVLKTLKGKKLSENYLNALATEARHSLFSIDSVQEFKRILKACHNEIRNNEGYDPTVAFDELSKVMFCKLHEEKADKDNRFTLDVFDDTIERLGINVVSQIFNETKVDPKYSGLFAPDDQINLHDRTVRRIVGLFQDYDLSITGFDVKGEAFEYFLGDTFTGGLGQYFTPRTVVQFIVEAIDPKIDESIIDPFCGTGGFLIFTFDAVNAQIESLPFAEADKEKRRKHLASDCLFGTDWAERTSQACKMNMVVHGDGNAKVYKHHGLLDVENPAKAGSFIFTEGDFDVCLTNPPFGSIENDPDILDLYELGAGRKSQDRAVLAMERAICLVKPGGRIGIVQIDGILNNASLDYVRDYIKETTQIDGIISLPPETFEGYGGRSATTVLLLTRKDERDDGHQDPVFMAVCENSGYAPNGDPISGSELPAILDEYQRFSAGEKLDGELNVWVVDELADRLDAQFYWSRDIEADLDQLREDGDEVTGLLKESVRLHSKVMREVESVFADLDTATVSVDELVEPVADRHKLLPGTVYPQVGVRWWGGGTFIREERLGRDIKAKTLFKVQEGWLVYNRLFAYRGSFALVSPECSTGYVSGEFPTFTAIETGDLGDLTLRYLVHLLNSPQYLLKVDSKSTGSTKQSRNRFKVEDFLAMEVAFPTDEGALRTVVKALDLADEVRARQDHLREAVREVRRGVARLMPMP